MPDPNLVELVTVGDELLLGFTIDTNGAFLARRLAERGLAVVRRAAVGDDLQSIASAVREALDRTGAVITTGGLGPTSDDLTRDAVASVFGRELRVDEAHVAWMQERWRSRFAPGMPRSHDALPLPGLAVEPTTGEVHLRHHVSPTGYYRGKKVVKTKAD